MRRNILIGVLGVTLLIAGCGLDEQQVTNPAGPTDTAGVPADGVNRTAGSQIEDRLNVLAHGLALALSKDSLRFKLFRDLRDSPFRFHQVELQSYLKGSDGRPLSEAAAEAVGMPIEQFYDLIPTSMVYQFGLQIPLDRVKWTGTPDILVSAWPYYRQERWAKETLTGFDVSGTQVEFPTYQRLQRVLLAIHPAEFVQFGRSPEETRQSAPDQDRSTVSSWSTESLAAIDMVGHDGAPASVSCPAGGGCGGGGGDGRGPAVTLSSQCSETSYTSTTSSNDLDQDGIKDACETEFAEKLGPRLALAYGESCEGREPYWTVQPDTTATGNGPRIGYLLSYYTDCGSLGHNGDSEFVIADTDLSSDTIRIWTLTLSAHWQAPNDHTTVQGGAGFDYVSLHPVVVVSESKHANYYSDLVCSIYETCDAYGQGFSQMWGFVSDANLGNWYHRFDLEPSYTGGSDDCVHSRLYPSSRPGVECYFVSTAFDGWHIDSDWTTPYFDVLTSFGLVE